MLQKITKKIFYLIKRQNKFKNWQIRSIKSWQNKLEMRKRNRIIRFNPETKLRERNWEK